MNPIDLILKLLSRPARARELPACATSETERNQLRAKAYQQRVSLCDDFEASPERMGRRATRGLQVMLGLHRHWRRLAAKKAMGEQVLSKPSDAVRLVTKGRS